MKPYKAFLFLLFVLVSFLTVLYLKEEPSGKLAVEELDDGLKADTFVEQKPDELPVPDTLQSADTVLKVVELPEKSLTNPVPFYFPQGDTVGFSYLFKKLRNIEQETLPVRITYFGDSQIENDRITSTLRKRLQAIFGGKGAGFIPLDHIYNPAHQLILERSNDWVVKTFQDVDYRNSSLLFKNSILAPAGKTGWFKLKRIISLNPQPDYELMKLYYLSGGDCKLDVISSGVSIYSGSLPEKSRVGVLDFKFNRTPDEIKFDFVSGDSLAVLGVSLESEKGILVDNIPLRGLSYPTFKAAWSEHLVIRQLETTTFFPTLDSSIFLPWLISI